MVTNATRYFITADCHTIIDLRHAGTFFATVSFIGLRCLRCHAAKMPVAPGAIVDDMYRDARSIARRGRATSFHYYAASRYCFRDAAGRTARLRARGFSRHKTSRQHYYHRLRFRHDRADVYDAFAASRADISPLARRACGDAALHYHAARSYQQYDMIADCHKDETPRVAHLH